jgi:hypothetical protein
MKYYVTLPALPGKYFETESDGRLEAILNL